LANASRGGLNADRATPEEYAREIDYGIELTDLAKGAFGADATLKPADLTGCD
jgi:hypothetical protein